jgi:2-aminoadipate transaminase
MSTTNRDFPISARAERATVQPIGELMAKGAEKDIISLAAGLVDEETLPARQIAALFADFIRERGPKVLQYGVNEGLHSLRRKVLDRLASSDGPSARDVPLSRVMLSTGSQQMLYILTEIMVDPGDIVITAAPTYFVYLGTLQLAGARIVGIPADEDGMSIDALESAIDGIVKAGDGPRLKLVYVTTYFDNPSGVSLSVERRRQLLRVVQSSGAVHPLVIEDAAYRELSFGDADTPSIWSFDDHGANVAHLGTFSKPFSPGLRTGFAVLPRAIAEKASILKCSHDFGSANLTQHLIDYCIERGLYDSNVEVLRKTYAAKCALMCQCLERDMRGLALWRAPGGGLYVWVDMPGFNTGPSGDLFANCASEGVIYVPGQFSYPDPAAGPKSKMRLCFGPATASDIERGIGRLARAARRTPPSGGAR